MAINLVSTILQSLTPDVVAKIASLLGIDRGLAQKAIEAGVPAILASFTSCASNPDGARQLSSALAQQPAGALDQIRSSVGGPGLMSIADGGTRFLSTLLGGSSMNTLADAIGSFAGIGTNTSKSLLGFVGPIIAGMLGQQQKSAGLDASGLANLLASQKDQIADAMPAGLSRMLSGTDLFHAFDGSMRSAADTAGRYAGAASDAATRAGQSTYTTARAATASAAQTSWPYWVLGLAALAALGWYLLSNNGGTQVADQPTTPSATVGSGGPVTVTDLTNQLTTSVSSVRTALQRMTDPVSARAALPNLQQASDQIDRVNTLATQLPSDARQSITSSIKPMLTSLDPLFDKVLSSPELAAIAKPTIDALRAKLQALARA